MVIQSMIHGEKKFFQSNRIGLNESEKFYLVSFGILL